LRHHGYLLKAGGRTRSISDFIDFTKCRIFCMTKSVIVGGPDEMRLRIRAIGALLKKFEMNESDTFRLFIKPFMDART